MNKISIILLSFLLYTNIVSAQKQPCAFTAAIDADPVVLCTSNSSATLTAYMLPGYNPNLLYTYLWSGGLGTNPVVNVIGPGSYSVTITNSGGCSSTATYNLQVTNLSASITFDEACDYYLLTANPNESPSYSPYTYFWSPGSVTLQTYPVGSPITYYVTVTNAVGCTAGANYTVTSPFVHVQGTFTGTDASCDNCDGEIQLDAIGGQPPYTYNWTGPNNFTSNLEDLTGLCFGEYNVTITDVEGCTWTGSHYVYNLLSSEWPIDIKNTYGNEEINDIITDPNGNVYAIGTFSGDIDPDENGIYDYNTFPNGRSIFVVAYDHCGRYLNHRIYGGINNPGPFDFKIKLIYTNHLAIAGEYNSIDFTTGGNPLPDDNSHNIFIAVLDRNTLTATPNNQVGIFSTNAVLGRPDIFKGLAVAPNGTWITLGGGFSGLTLQGTSPNWANRTNTTSTGENDLFFCRFQFSVGTQTLSLIWDRNDYSGMFSDLGMTMVMPSTVFWFTYQFGNSASEIISRIVKVNNAGDITDGPFQIGTGTDFYHINDMVGVGDLYLCGYYKTSSSDINQRAVVIRYPYQWGYVNIQWNAATEIYANQFSPTTYNTNVATHMHYTNNINNTGFNLFVSGAYDKNNYQIGNTGLGWSQLIPYYNGLANHFVFKTNWSLNPSSGWLTGAMTGTVDGSYATSLCYDASHNVYFIGGLFNGQVCLNDNPPYSTQQTMVANYAFDAFIGRFIDNNTEAEFRSATAGNLDTKENKNLNVILYPNPAMDIIHLNSNNGDGILQVHITDLTGRIVYSYDNTNQDINLELDISFLQQGNYFVTVKTLNNIYVEKLVVVR